MGRKSRNKKRSQELRAASQAVKIMTLFEFAQDCFSRMGRGMLVYPGIPGTGAQYVTDADLVEPEDANRVFISRYDPQIEFVLHRPVDPRRQDGPWTTRVLREGEHDSNLKIGIPREVES